MTDKKEAMLKKLLYIVAGFGVLLTIVTELSHHYEWIMELCGGGSSGCADVASTPFAKMFGISVAYWGLLSYVAFIFVLVYAQGFALLIASALMGAELYFLWIMNSIIGVYCTFCLIQLGTVTVLFLLSLLWSFRRVTEKSPPYEKLWTTPIIVLLAFAVLAVPVKLRSGDVAQISAIPTTYAGNINSSIKVEVYSDYQCGHCRNLEPVIDKLMENHPDILLIFRDYILPNRKISPVAVSYANAIAIIKGRESFIRTRREMFLHQDNLRGYLEKRLPKIEFTDEMRTKISAKAAADKEKAKALGIYQTPSIVIYRGNDVVQIIKGGTTYEKLLPFLKDSNNGK